MEKQKTFQFGFRGWMLLFFAAGAMLAYSVFPSYPMSITYAGNSVVSAAYTAGVAMCIVIQLILSGFMSKIRLHPLSVAMGAVTLVFVIPVILMGKPLEAGQASPGILWMVLYFVVVLCSNLASSFAVCALIGQWFPRKKGSFMGVVTIIFPLANGYMGPFESIYYANLTNGGSGFIAYLPVWILAAACLILGIVFVRDYPEQCGAYRDNDRNFTPEMAKAMMEEEIQNKKTSVWTIGRIIRVPDFWLLTVPCGLMLMTAIGMSILSYAIVSIFQINYTMVTVIIMVFGAVGSYIIGYLDAKLGTRKAMIITAVLMILSGVFGLMNTPACIVISYAILSLFLGGASNFPVSAPMQYWRSEDFGNVFALLNPIANIFTALAALVVTLILNALGYRFDFAFVVLAGVICLACLLLFRSKHVKEYDDKYRKEAGKPLDDALENRL